MLAGVERTVQKDGINFGGLAYVAPELHGRGGQRVQIRYMPHDDRSIEVYDLPTFEDAAVYLRADWAHQLDRLDDECPSYGHATGKTLLPPYAADIIAAHLAHRRADGAGTLRRFFADPKDPGLDTSDRALTEMVLRTCRSIGFDPVWLHRGHCEFAKLGSGPAPMTDWMAARRLDAKILSDRGAAL